MQTVVRHEPSVTARSTMTNEDGQGRPVRAGAALAEERNGAAGVVQRSCTLRDSGGRRWTVAVASERGDSNRYYSELLLVSQSPISNESGLDPSEIEKTSLPLASMLSIAR